MKRHAQLARVASIGALWLALAPAHALAARPKSICTWTHERALASEQKGRLREARDLFQSCTTLGCSSFLKRDCAARFTMLDADIPSVVPLAMDAAGEPLVDVRVTIDGEPLTSRLDGHSLPVDPGVHEFSFTAPGKVALAQKMMIAQGQRNLTISVALQDPVPEAREEIKAPPPAPITTEQPPPHVAVVQVASPPPSGDTPAIAYVFGGTALASFGAGALLTSWGRKDNGALAACAPSCKPESIDHVRRMYLGADVAFGVGFAAVAGTIWALVAGTSADEASSAISVQPAKSGAVATWSGRF